jgi:hypothetical protein
MHSIITLVERDFLYGASILYNSLVRNGFDGLFIVGVRDVAKLPVDLYGRFDKYARGTRSVELVEVATDEHFTNYKPHFMQDVLAARPAVSKITYIDPDIVCACPWRWMDCWCENGPAMCGDVNWWMPRDHPTRWEWKKYLAKEGLTTGKHLDLYFNGGLVSLLRRDESFLKRWMAFTQIAVTAQGGIPTTGDIGAWRQGGREGTFHTPDQDALNITAMSWEGGISTFGPDAMGFAPGVILLPHAVGPGKPWQRNYLTDALRGRPPRLVDRAFWNNALGPVPVASPASVRAKKLAIALGAALGRVYRRR